MCSFQKRGMENHEELVVFFEEGYFAMDPKGMKQATILL
jgi:hypothetical protein